MQIVGIHSGGVQVGDPPSALAAVQSELLPATWRLLSSLLLVHSLATIPAATLAAPSGVDFSQRLSTLQIGEWHNGKTR